jgi:hypothetical protein
MWYERIVDAFAVREISMVVCATMLQAIKLVVVRYMVVHMATYKNPRVLGYSGVTWACVLLHASGNCIRRITHHRIGKKTYLE